MAEAANTDIVSFGPFQLNPAARLLLKHGAEVELGARTLDILAALVSRPNQPLTKRELLALVWPDVTVEEGSLRFHIAALRRALGDGQNGARYIATLAGRGYCFVAPVHAALARAPTALDTPRPAFLPSRLARMVGRDDTVRTVAARLAASRFVSIVGPGGVGKTTVAVAVAHDLLAAFGGEVLFVDFGMLSDARMVPASVASMLGLSIDSDDPMPGLIGHLRDRRMLVILDNCEHVVEPAARLAAQMFAAAPQVQILATSREALRVEGEHVHRLMPLAVPPDDPALTAAAALAFPATQLFVERATAGGATLELADANAAVVAGICRKLDGMALAIELAASRVEAYGLHQTAALLDQRLTLLWPGQRTAPPRQKTLQATLDWSYRLLSETERLVFRRAAVFVGPFTIEAALAVVAGEAVDAPEVFAAIDSLVAKSMLATRPAGAMLRYLLLDTARAYALGINVDDAERAALARRHAAWCLRWLEQSGADEASLSDTAERAPFLVGLNNVRAALEWCFGAAGDSGIGVQLAAAAMPAFLALSLLSECHRWSRRALAAAAPESVAAMQLQAGLGLSSMLRDGHDAAARVALTCSLGIAEACGDVVHQLEMLGLLHMFHHRGGEIATALAVARRSAGVAATVASPAALSLAQMQMGISLKSLGDLGAARAAFEAALQPGSDAPGPGTFLLGYDHRAIASGYLARILWLQGHPAQALDLVHRTVRHAAHGGRPLTLSYALTCAVSLLLWFGDLRGADEHLAWLAGNARSHSQPLFLALSRGLAGQMAIGRGDDAAGVAALEDCVRSLQAAKYRVWLASFNISRARGLAALGRSGEAVTLIEATIRITEADGVLTYLPEALRVQAGILLSLPQPDADAAVACLERSLACSRSQGARTSELRAAIDLASLWAREGRHAAARALLLPVCKQFTDGLQTADLAAAARLLAALGASDGAPRRAARRRLSAR